MRFSCVQHSHTALIPLLLLSSFTIPQPSIGQTVSTAPANRLVPSLDELAGKWWTASDLLSFPALNNMHGAAQTTGDILSITDVTFPPITMSGQTAALLVDDKTPVLDQVRWYPYQVLRKGHAGQLDIETAVRLPFEHDGLLFHISVTNPETTSITVELRINLSANTALHDHWGWKVPRDEESKRFSATTLDSGASLILRDARGELCNCYSFEQKPTLLTAREDSGHAIWKVTLQPKSSYDINFAFALGRKESDVRDQAISWAKHFPDAFQQVHAKWQARFDAMFTRGNAIFSGHLPTLISSDDKLRRMYYMSAVSLLSACRTSFPMAARVYVSNSPESNCTMIYFWDTREWATTLALLDPEMLKKYLRDWLARGIYRGYAEEYLTGTLQGPWYSANDYSIFILLDSYLNVTGDRAFLSETIDVKTVLQHMDAIATHWKQLVRPGRTLADYGKASNLLECVPTYINEVASFNAANIWMMRRIAAIDESLGDKTRAAQLRADADHLLPAVLALYEPGQGVWNSLHRDGTKVQIRHVFDFATIGLTIKSDLSADMRREMTRFVESELLTDHWMRAQSLSDAAAAVSNRPDHGPMGAFCAWPAETMAVFCEFGEYDKALDLLHRCTETTYEGPFSQSRELLTRERNSPVHITNRGGRGSHQTYNASNGGAFAETILRGFFGYQPDLFKDKIVPHPAPRGFEGELINVRQGDRNFDITSTPAGIQVAPAK